MKILLSSRGLFLFGFLIIIATNIVVLSGVVFNKSGEPESQVTLSERELQLPYKIHKENSGLALRLTWGALGKIDEDNYSYGRRSPAWFTAEKLEELEININEFLSLNGDNFRYKQPIPKEVFIVLENGGEPYREAVKRAEAALAREKNTFELNPDDKVLLGNFERAEKQLKRERTEKTRLFAIDAGLDASELREKYGDRTRFIIAKGLVEPKFNHTKNKKEVFGYISRLSVTRINVPLKHRQIFDSILAQDKSNKNEFRSPRFEVKLAHGNRLEPWIISVRFLDDKS